MVRLMIRPFPATGARPSPLNGIAWIIAAVAWTSAALVGAVLAVAFAAVLVIFAAMSSLLLGLAAGAVKVRRTFGASHEGVMLEARRVGGHSWVAYGWDRGV